MTFQELRLKSIVWEGMGLDTSQIENGTPFQCANAPSSRTSFANTESSVLRAAASGSMVLKTVLARHSGS